MSFVIDVALMVGIYGLVSVALDLVMGEESDRD